MRIADDVAYGYKGKGILIHTLTEGNGMPLANCTTAANGSEREQIIPLLDSVRLKTLKKRCRDGGSILSRFIYLDLRLNVIPPIRCPDEVFPQQRGSIS